jgi:proliferating cell nuclear antigen PCNA
LCSSDCASCMNCVALLVCVLKSRVSAVAVLNFASKCVIGTAWCHLVPLIKFEGKFQTTAAPSTHISIVLERPLNTTQLYPAEYMSSEPTVHVGADKNECLVHFQTLQSVKLRTLFETLNPLLVDANLVFDKDGLYLSEVASNMLVNFAITNIDDYYCPKRIVVGVNLSLIFTIIKNVTQDDVICLQITKSGMQKALSEMHLYTISENGCNRANIKLMTIEEMFYEPPEKKFDTIVTLATSQLQRIFRNHEKCGDYMQVLCEKDKKSDDNTIYFITKGDDYDFLTKVSTSDSIIEDDGNATSLRRASDKPEMYKLRFLTLIAKATNLSPTVNLYLAKDYPLILRYQIGTLGFVMFALAANVDESDVRLGSDELKGLVDANTIMASTTTSSSSSSDSNSSKRRSDAEEPKRKQKTGLVKRQKK